MKLTCKFFLKQVAFCKAEATTRQRATRKNKELQKQMAVNITLKSLRIILTRKVTTRKRVS